MSKIEAEIKKNCNSLIKKQKWQWWSPGTWNRKPKPWWPCSRRQSWWECRGGRSQDHQDQAPGEGRSEHVIHTLVSKFNFATFVAEVPVYWPSTFSMKKRGMPKRRRQRKYLRCTIHALICWKWFWFVKVNLEEPCERTIWLLVHMKNFVTLSYKLFSDVY